MIDIPNYEGLYAATEDGQIYSYKRKKFLKQGANGYQMVTLYKNKVAKYLYVHRLVAQAYLPNPNNLPEVNHKDENCLNNAVSNLEWCTHKYNLTYGTRLERAAKTLSSSRTAKYQKYGETK